MSHNHLVTAITLDTLYYFGLITNLYYRVCDSYIIAVANEDPRGEITCPGSQDHQGKATKNRNSAPPVRIRTLTMLPRCSQQSCLGPGLSPHVSPEGPGLLQALVYL